MLRWMIFTSKCGHGKQCPPSSRCPGIKRAGNLFQDFLLGGAAGGRLVFGFESSGQIGPKIRYNLCDKVNFVGVLKEVPTPFYTVGLIHIHNSHILYQPA
ncbi:hypothetical protein GT748_00525 [Bittarella massiliensis]|uniref:Uncharacterized protein n=1 Tax=Bittarella massiliensis (ex Durand et al. 2017) TaxID=1720313 RepID=A0ABW9WWC7_9FIRM|nr:hypothetical protein [Bittarella massiliensis (ex Durand et al. 2017)]MZL79120.1 hypothetical protein [Bittarella massiliensis (ex Durand et al. 2017)]